MHFIYFIILMLLLFIIIGVLVMNVSEETKNPNNNKYMRIIYRFLAVIINLTVSSVPSLIRPSSITPYVAQTERRTSERRERRT